MHSASPLSTSVRLSRSVRPVGHANRGRLCARTRACQNLARHKPNTVRVVAMAHTVFVYGTLLSEEIVQILLSRTPDSYKGEALQRSELQKAFLPT